MKVLVLGNELSDALNKVVKALPLKRNNPILEGIKLTAKDDTLTLFATDTELAIEKKINATVLIEGEVVVPGKLFAEYAKKIKDEEISLDGTDENKLFVKYLDSAVTINCYNKEEYPVFSEVSKENSFMIMKNELKSIISRIIINVAVDEARPSMRGCCFNIKENEVEGVASDGYRLALSKASIKNNGIVAKIVVPARSLREVNALLEDEKEAMAVYVDENFVMIDLFHTKIVTRLIGEEYINYETLIPNLFTTEITLDKKMFESAVERVSLINKTERQSCVKIDIKEDVIELKAQSEEGEVNEKLTIKLKGKDLTIGFNSKFILDCMKEISTSFITFNFNSSTRPAIIKGEDNTWLYLILPLRVIG